MAHLIKLTILLIILAPAGTTLNAFHQVEKSAQELLYSLPEKLLTLENILVNKGRNNDSIAIITESIIPFAEEIEDPIMKANFLTYWSFTQFNHDTSATYLALRGAFNLFEKKNNNLGMGKVSYHMGHYHGIYGNYSEKKQWFLKAIYYLENESVSDKKLYWFNAYNGLASIYKDTGFFTEAVEAGMQARKFADATDDEIYKMRAILNIGAIYGELYLDGHSNISEEKRKEYKAFSLKCFKEAYEVALKESNHHYLMITAFNLGLNYSEEKSWDLSHQYLDKSILYALDREEYDDLFTAYEIKGDNYRDAGKPLEAHIAYLKAIGYSEKCRSIDIQIRGKYLKGKYNKEKGFIDEAIAVTKEGLDLAIENDIMPRIIGGYNNLYSVYKIAGKHKEALAYYEQENALNEALIDDKNLKDLEVLKAKYENLENKNKITILEKNQTLQALSFQRNLKWFIGGGIALLLGGLLWYLHNRNKALTNKQKNIELEQRLLRSQMNPHFTFNALSSIQKYLLKDGEAKKGAYFLAKYAKLIRHILDQSSEKFITLEEEIESLENYLAIQQLRFDTSFSYSINFEKDVDLSSSMIPPMMIQPIVENAIEHGKIYAIEDGKIEINFSKTRDLLMVKIIDNGLGINKANQKSPTNAHKSVALSIIHDRIEYLKENNNAVDFKIISNQERGTLVHFCFPNMTT